MDSLDTFVKLTKMVNASEKANSNKNGGNQNENSKKKSSNKYPTERPIMEATISKPPNHAKSMRESIPGANAQTINSSRTTSGTMVESQSTLREPKPRRKRLSRRNPRTKPTSFEKRESQAREIIMTLYKTKTITR
jgi:hypothetical protein